jgi:type I restriction enzyme S subunit
MKHNWEYKRLGEVCDKGTSNIAQKDLSFTEDGYNIFGASGLLGKVDFFKQTDSYIGIVKDGSGVGRVNVYPAYSSLIGTMQYIIARDIIRTDFLAYTLKSLNLSRYASGAAIPHIYFRDYQRERVPVPPIAVQEQIVAELDKINEVIADNREMLKQLSALQKSIFYDMFGDPVNNPMHWGTSKLKDVAPAIPSKLKPLELGGKIWLLNLDQIESNSGNIIQIQFFDKSEVGSSTVSFDTDNVLYSKLRPYLNKVVIPLSNGICTSELIPLRPQKEILNKIYLGFALRLPEFVDYINGKTGGAKMPRVKMPYFWAFELPVPPLSLQEEFAKKIEAIEAQKATIESNIKELQTLLDSRMDYWFN